MEADEKLNKYERYKMRKCPYDFFPEIRSLDFENISDADRYYLQDFGIFNADFLEGEFTIRIRVPGGRLTARQFQSIADIVAEHDLHIILTARAGMQIHGLYGDNVLEVFDQINALEITTWQSFGDNVRNIVTDIYDGVGEHCEIEAYPIIMQMQEKILKNPRYVGMLPRRISVGVSGNRANVVSLFANDLYFALAEKEGTLGFNVYMGGKNSEIAKDANIFLLKEEVPDFFAAFVETFFIHGLRKSRWKSRLFHLLEQIGMEQFKEYVQEEYAKPFEPAGKLLLQKEKFTQSQKLKDGTYAFCYQTDFARLDVKEITEIAKYATQHDAQIRFGIDQNIYLLGLKEKTLPLNSPKESATIVACAGSEYCPFSYWSIKNETVYLPLDKINEHRLQVGFSGCAKGCGRHQHSDIGLIGLRTNNFGAAEGGARIFLGAEHSGGHSVGRMIFSMVPLEHLHSLLTLIIQMYEQSGYKDFEEYAGGVLNTYSEDFIALWLLANTQTGRAVDLKANSKIAAANEEERFKYEKDLLHENFAGVDFLELIEDNFKSVVSTVSKKLWTIEE
ncbi:nitrite/sulfite reductase [Sulfurimonas sp. HSL-1716]|uniref:nitrite/sulfite reductase n=1 Tax=Hydrocurvibacter sulfurireducens TaxID=3131937 RepID=UPI0031FA12C9